MQFFKHSENADQNHPEPCLGVLNPGEVVEVLDSVVDSRGKMKVQHARGWTPLKSPNGDRRKQLQPEASRRINCMRLVLLTVR